MTANALRLDPQQQRQRLHDPARQLLSRAHLGGVPFDEVVNLLNEINTELENERSAEEDKS